MSRQDKVTTERNTKTLRELVKKPENKVCADCKRNDPRWASWNLGVFLCIRCSGIHRGMGTHISKVKSVDLDAWTPEQMESIQKWGNRLANLYWEAHLKQGHIPPEHKLESFIRSKYESRRWALDGPPPTNPSDLDQAPSQFTVATSEDKQHIQTGPQATRLSNNNQTTPSVTRQSQSHQLLSTTFSNRHPSSPKVPVAPVQTIHSAQQQTNPENELFSLDFHAPAPTMQPSNSASNLPQKDVKQDILSLFSSPAVGPLHNPNFGNLNNTSPWGVRSEAQPQPTSMMGSSGVGAWGATSGWTNPQTPPTATGMWSSLPGTQHTQQHTNLFDTNAVWAGSSSSSNQPTNTTSPFSGSSQQKDDAFGDLWGGFK